MKRNLSTLVFAFLTWLTTSQAQNLVNIPDPAFKAYLTREYLNIDTDKDGEISINEAEACTHLYIFDKELTNVDGIEKFSNVIDLRIYAPLSSLTEVPSTLKNFTLVGSTITSLPNLPESLDSLLCDNNELTSLPILPKNLKGLGCRFNKISTLPTLPETLGELFCGNNLLTSLPTLPSNLVSLGFENNKISTLQQLPSAIKHLYCNNNLLTALPKLPSNLMVLLCNNNNISCIPFLPKNISYIVLDDYLCIPNRPNNNNFTIYNGQYIQSNLEDRLCLLSPNNNNCNVYPVVKGHIYIDVNDDKKFTSGIDFPYSNAIIISDYTTNTNKDGEYYFVYEDLNTKKTITPKLPSEFSTTISFDTVNFKNFNEIRFGKDFIINTSNLNDVKVDLISSVQRPGFNTYYNVQVKNNGYQKLNANVKLEYDSRLTFSDTIINATISISEISWIVEDLKPFESRNFSIRFILDANAQLGTYSNAVASVKSSLNDINPNDNTDTISTIIQGSYDPNDISVNKGSEVLRAAIQNQENFDYTIRFQNTGSDTAFTVVVKDTLPSNLDLSSIQITNSSSPYLFTLKGNVATWTFKKINLPDSTTNEKASHGFVKYAIKPLSTVQINETIDNTAAIYFDFNTPVVTNTVSTRVTNITGLEDELSNQFTLYPNPSKGEFKIDLKESLATVQIINPNGTVVIEKTSKGISSFDLRNESKGLYFVKVISNNETTVSKIVIE